MGQVLSEEQQSVESKLDIPDIPDADDLRVLAEEWFISRGMPTAAFVSTRRYRLLVRSAPIFFAIAFNSLLISIIDFIIRLRDPGYFEDDGLWTHWYILLVATTIPISLGVGWFINRRIRHGHLSPARERMLAFAGPLLGIGVIVIDQVLGISDDFLDDLLAEGIQIIVVLALVRSGIGALIIWSLRQAAKQSLAVVQLTARVLPTIVLVTLFAFLSSGLWEVTGALPRGRVWEVVAILVAIAAFFAWAVIRDEMSSVMRSPHPDILNQVWEAFPPGRKLPGTLDATQPLQLSRREWANAALLVFIAQLAQFIVLVALIFAFFCLFGSVAIPESILMKWTGHAHDTSVLLGVHFPVHEEIVDAALVLGAFSAVSFAASSASEATYRKRFFEPILQDVAVTIAARHLYHSSLDERGRILAPDNAATLSERPD